MENFNYHDIDLSDSKALIRNEEFIREVQKVIVNKEDINNSSFYDNCPKLNEI